MKIVATETTWATHVNVIAATIVIQTTATTNARAEGETKDISETIAMIGDHGNSTIAKTNDHADPLLQDRATILAL